MEIKRKITKWPENLQVKAMVTLAQRDITELAHTIGQSRNWLNRVLNGHERGIETIELIKKELEKSAQ